ncbi:MAG: hypothetical protein ACYCT9_04810 [Leptospirillum sp.]|jgi:hypothetical protein
MDVSFGIGIALSPFRVKSTGMEYHPGEKVEAPEEKLRLWAEKGLVQIEDSDFSRLFSNGRPTGATLADPPHIRVYAWCLVNLRFGPMLSSPTDLCKAAEECRLSIEETREAIGKLLREGDLQVERDRRARTEIYFLAPIKW